MGFYRHSYTIILLPKVGVTTGFIIYKLGILVAGIGVVVVPPYVAIVPP